MPRISSMFRSTPRPSTSPTSSPASSPAAFQPKPLGRATPLTNTPGASSPAAFQPKPLGRATPLANAPGANAPTGTPPKHPGMPEGGPSYTPWEKTSGESLSVSGGDNKLTAPPAAHQNMLVDKPGSPFQKDTFGGGKLSGNLGSMQASTTSHNGGGVHHYSAQAEMQGPHAALEWQKAHAGRFGVTSGQVTAEANSFKGQAQAGVSIDRNDHVYTGAMTAKAETGVGVTASANHDFNRHVGGYVKGDARASAAAYAEGVASLDPRTATAMVSGQVGAGATAGAYGTAGGHLGRLHGSVTGGVVAGAAAQAGGKFGLENGFLKQSAEVNAAAGVGTYLKSDVAVDMRHHIKPSIAEGLRPSLAGATGVASPANVVQPEKSWVEKLFI